MQRVMFIDNPMEPKSWEVLEVEDARALIVERYPAWPQNARIYHGTVAETNDVTPRSEADVERLTEYDFLAVVVFPEGPLVALIVAVVVAVVATVALMLLLPKIPGLANTQQQSPNNALADRGNRPRLNGRIPDIFGRVRSTPDLIAVPYKVFENNIEKEVAFMCVGRGAYQVSDIRDDTTPISQIDGASVEVYAPFTSPLASSVPQLRVGSAITAPVVSAKRSNAVNGQKLDPPSGARYLYIGLKFIGPDRVVAEASSYDYDVGYIPTDLTQIIGAGDTVSISAPAWIAPNGTAYNFSGAYTVNSVSALELTLDEPAGAGWDYLTANPTVESDYIASYITAEGDEWVGPFIVELEAMNQLYVNFVAANGLYKDNGRNKYPAPVTVEVEITALNSSNGVVDGPRTYSATLPGSATDRTTQAVTLKIGTDLAIPGRCRVRARRVTAADTAFEGTVVDEVKWRDLYAVAPVGVQHFGDVTTALAVTNATEGALAVKERKINMMVTRLIPTRISGTDFTAPQATRNAADIMVAACRDPYIGGRPLDEIDLDSIYGAVAEAVDYFGSDEAGEFAFTFDDDGTSFEETAATIAQAVFATAYRQGSKIRMHFERATEDSEMLFNHRNKVPGSEGRSVSFGSLDDNDGIELEYVSPDNDTPATLYIPADRSAVKPRKIEARGVRSHLQGYWQGWRAYNKVRYQNQAVEFTALQEAAPLIRTSRIRVADNTRPDTQDGEVLDQIGLEIETSQPVSFDTGEAYTVFLQLPDGTLDAIGAAPGSSAHHILLARPPREALAIGDDLYAQATYQLIRNDSPRETAFLVAEKEPQEDGNYQIKAINYSPLYYQNDQLLLWLTFDDYSAADKSAWKNDGTYRGGSGAVSDVDRGLVYAGAVGRWIDLPDLNTSPSYTFMAWVLPNSGGHLKSLLGVVSGNALDITVEDGVLTVSHNGVSVATSVTFNQWKHIAVSFDADDGMIRVYVNGDLITEAANVAPAGAVLQLFQSRGAQRYAGRADDVRFYPVGLTADEVRAIYRSTQLGNGSSAPTYDDPDAPVEPPVDPEEPPPGITVQIDPPHTNTSSYTDTFVIIPFNVIVTGAVAEAYVWGVGGGDAYGWVAAGQGTASAQLGCYTIEYFGATAEFYCDVVIAGQTYRATCSMTHAYQGSGFFP